MWCTNKIVISILVLFIILSMSGCTNSEVQAVVDIIDAIGEVSVDSKSDIDAAVNAYNSLSLKDQSKVKNIDVLTTAQNEFEVFVPEYISSQITRYKTAKNPNAADLEQFVEEFYDQLDNAEKEIINCAIGKCQIEELTISVVKQNMLDPSSFELIDFYLDDVIKGPDETYYGLVEISFRGTNSFGGVVPNKLSGSIQFTVNANTFTIWHVDSIFF